MEFDYTYQYDQFSKPRTLNVIGSMYPAESDVDIRGGFVIERVQLEYKGKYRTLKTIDAPLYNDIVEYAEEV